MHASTITPGLIVMLLAVSITLLCAKHPTSALVVTVVAALIVVFSILCSANTSTQRLELGPQPAAQMAAASTAAHPRTRGRTRTKTTPKVSKLRPRSKVATAEHAEHTEHAAQPNSIPPILTANTSSEENVSVNKSLPTCAPSIPDVPQTARQVRANIRANGLYGVHGDLGCRKMQRASVADKGIVQPLKAREQMLHFLAVDQMHAKDSSLIPRTAQKTIS